MFSTGYKIYPVENTVYPVGVSSGRISCGEHSRCGEQLWRTLIYPVDDMVYPVENLLWMTISCGGYPVEDTFPSYILWRTYPVEDGHPQDIRMSSTGPYILWRTAVGNIMLCRCGDGGVVAIAEFVQCKEDSVAFRGEIVESGHGAG